MSWLDDIRQERFYNYELEDGSVIQGTLKKLSELSGVDVQGDHGEKLTIDGHTATYKSFEPIKIQQRNEITYEKNGLKAVMKRDADGNMTYVSQTQIHYQQTGKIEVQYTKEFQRQAEKNLQFQMQKENAMKKKPGYRDPILDMVKNLPDGEFVGDGQNFVPAEDYVEEIKYTATSNMTKED
jgi:hypothetical protein